MGKARERTIAVHSNHIVLSVNGLHALQARGRGKPNAKGHSIHPVAQGSDFVRFVGFDTTSLAPP